MDYLDLYLIHWPLRISQDAKSVPLCEDHVYPLDIKSVWEAMEECQNMGLTKAIGVSNFSCKKLTELLTYAKIRPAVNQVSHFPEPFITLDIESYIFVTFAHFPFQVELSPAWHQKQLLLFCRANDIHVTAYSPLGASGTKWGDNRILESPVLQEIAEARGKSVAQVIEIITNTVMTCGNNLISITSGSEFSAGCNEMGIRAGSEYGGKEFQCGKNAEKPGNI